MTFVLIPQELWGAGEPRIEDALGEGVVHLYQTGDYFPRLTAAANQPIEVSTGSWHWIAEAPGYVSVSTGTITVSDASAEFEKQLVWPVVPACEYILDSDQSWLGVQRLDVVSPHRNAVYPLNPSKRRRLWIPTGEVVIYSLRSGNLIGIEALEGCAQNETTRLLPPDPPGPRHQDLLIHALLPEGDEAGSNELTIVFQASDELAPVLPDATVTAGNRTSAFFLDLAAESEGEVIVRHPELRTALRHVEPLGGSAREIPGIELRPRLDLTVSVDYEPERSHAVQVLEAFFCGPEKLMSGRGRNSCSTSVAETPLQPGFNQYLIEDLDDGRYIVNARIDDEVIIGLGVGFSPYIDPDSSVPPQAPVVRLREMEIYGNLLLDGEPVPGEVRLEPLSPTAPERRFPTDEDLLYHLYYFGRMPFGSYLLPGDEDRDPEDLLGLYYYALSACAENGPCRTLHPDSLIRGEGRLDVDLGSLRELEVRVLDAEDRTPLVGAVVRRVATDEILIFANGETHSRKHDPADGIRGVALRTDSEGRVRFGNVEEGLQQFSVSKAGYVRNAGTAVAPLEGKVVAEVALKRKGPSEGNLMLRFPNGEPVARAFLLVVDGEGNRQRCSVSTDAGGMAAFQDGCLDSRVVVLFHPRARLSVFDGDAISGLAEVSVPYAPTQPLRIQVVDPAGRPVAGLPIQLYYRGVTIGPNDLLMVMGRTGNLPFYLTDENGEMLLRGVDPEGTDVPEVALLAESSSERTRLLGYRAGDTVELVMDAGQ